MFNLNIKRDFPIFDDHYSSKFRNSLKSLLKNDDRCFRVRRDNIPKNIICHPKFLLLYETNFGSNKYNDPEIIKHNFTMDHFEILQNGVIIGYDNEKISVYHDNCIFYLFL